MHNKLLTKDSFIYKYILIFFISIFASSCSDFNIISKDTKDIVEEVKEEDKKVVKPIVEIIDYKEEIYIETSEIKIANKIAVMLPMTGK